MDHHFPSGPKAGFPRAGDFLLPLRLVTGWTYFSAFWRRLVLENKLIPDDPGYLGEKFNHFLPNALLIKPAIEFFVTHPEALWWKLVLFTIVEAVVGFALMAGFMTRAAGAATALLALGILLGAGWLGTTCLDEWQIGVLGVSAGLAFFFAGGGRYSADFRLNARYPALAAKPFGRLLFTDAPLFPPRVANVLLPASGVAALLLALWTNQVFHGGVWGTLHNKSVTPKVEVTGARVTPEGLRFTAMRVEGADVYGSFLTGVRVLDAAGEPKMEWSAEELSRVPAGDIANRYVAKIKPGAGSLILPLGAKAEILLRKEASAPPAGNYTVELKDISGLEWTAPLVIGEQS